jgi:hypothetical protein
MGSSNSPQSGERGIAERRQIFTVNMAKAMSETLIQLLILLCSIYKFRGTRINLLKTKRICFI